MNYRLIRTNANPNCNMYMCMRRVLCAKRFLMAQRYDRAPIVGQPVYLSRAFLRRMRGHSCYEQRSQTYPQHVCMCRVSWYVRISHDAEL